MLVERSLKSLERQTHENFEVIVVCDGCKAPDLLKDEYWWVDWIEIEKKHHYPDEALVSWLVGPSHALNIGLRHAEGQWIARMDDDDVYRPKMLETMLAFALEHDYEFVSAVAKGPDGPIQPYTHPVVGSVQTWLYRGYLSCFTYNLSSWRKPWNRNNEIDLYQRMHRAGVRMGFKPCVVTDIRPRPGLSVIGSKAWEKRKE